MRMCIVYYVLVTVQIFVLSIVPVLFVSCTTVREGEEHSEQDSISEMEYHPFGRTNPNISNTLYDVCVTSTCLLYLPLRAY
jgi:hypothetical protein